MNFQSGVASCPNIGMIAFARSFFVRIESFTDLIMRIVSVRLHAFGTRREESCSCNWKRHGRPFVRGRSPSICEGTLCRGDQSAIVERRRRIHAAGGDRRNNSAFQGLHIRHSESVFYNFNTAFIFKNTDQAAAFITEFADELRNPQILDCP